MKDEIKEILDNIEVNELKHHKWYCSVEKDNMQKLLDYITTLQEENSLLKEYAEKSDKLEIRNGMLRNENKELKEENETLKELNVCVGCNNNPDYKTRIDKAIEYIEEEITQGTDIYCKEKVDGIIVLEILKGDDNNAKD